MMGSLLHSRSGESFAINGYFKVIVPITSQGVTISTIRGRKVNTFASAGFYHLQRHVIIQTDIRAHGMCLKQHKHT